MHKQSFIFEVLIEAVRFFGFKMPPRKDLESISREERTNIFRRFFASSRYNRLLIQQALVKTAIDGSGMGKVAGLEKMHNRHFFDTVAKVKSYGFGEEFLAAVREEDQALQKIIEAYELRMNRYSAGPVS
jgi:hypothetical protein